MKSTLYTLLLAAGLTLAIVGCEKETDQAPTVGETANSFPATTTTETQPAVAPTPTPAVGNTAAGNTAAGNTAGTTVPTPGTTVPTPAGE